MPVFDFGKRATFFPGLPILLPSGRIRRQISPSDRPVDPNEPLNAKPSVGAGAATAAATGASNSQQAQRNNAGFQLGQPLTLPVDRADP